MRAGIAFQKLHYLNSRAPKIKSRKITVHVDNLNSLITFTVQDSASWPCKEFPLNKAPIRHTQ